MYMVICVVPTVHRLFSVEEEQLRST